MKDRINNFFNKKRKKGFTMVELLAVIVVIGIVMVLTIPSLFVNMNKSKKEAEIVFVKSIDKAINQFIATNKDDFKISDNDDLTILGGNGYKITKDGSSSFDFQYLIDEGFIDELVNPNKSDTTCSLDTDIEIYRDQNFVYYYRTDLNCISTFDGVSDTWNINTLP